MLVAGRHATAAGGRCTHANELYAQKSDSTSSMMLNWLKMSTLCPSRRSFGSSLFRSASFPAHRTMSCGRVKPDLGNSRCSSPRIRNGWLQHLRSSICTRTHDHRQRKPRVRRQRAKPRVGYGCFVRQRAYLNVDELRHLLATLAQEPAVAFEDGAVVLFLVVQPQHQCGQHSVSAGAGAPPRSCQCTAPAASSVPRE